MRSLQPDLAEKQRPVLVAVTDPNADPVPPWLMPALVLATFVPRLFLLPLNENLYGDAVIRTELAQRWIAHPHWISSFADGAFQFGPLHLYLMGIAYALIGHKELVGRLVSLLFGTLTVVPLFSLTRRLFGWRAGAIACLGLAVWGMHLQMSTTAASEALGLFLVMWMLSLFARGLDENRFTPIAYSALVLNLACATRYDCWLFVPLFCALLFFQDKDKVAATSRAIFFGLLALPFPLVWMQGNERAFGDPLKPIHYIQSFHSAWVADGIARYSAWGYRAMNLFFWPGAALFTLSPLVALLGAIGMVRAWRRYPQHRWLIWTALAPTALFTFKAAVLLDFVPLARFAVNQIALLLPFVYLGYVAIAERTPRWASRGIAALAAVIAVALPTAIGAYTFRADGPIQDSLRPVSPTSTNPLPVRQVSRYLKETVAPKGGAVILDTAPDYSDLQIAFFSGLDETRLDRVRWDTFDKLVHTQPPRTIVRYEKGDLEKRKDVQLVPGGLVFQGQRFDELPGFAGPWHVYSRAD